MQVPGSNPFGVILYVENDDIFDNARPSIDYAIDVCPIISAANDLVSGLEDKLVESISGKFQNSSATINFDKVSDFLVGNVSSTISDFSDNIIKELDSIDCDKSSARRFLQEVNSDKPSLATKIKDAIDTLNQTLKKNGIDVKGTIKPFFDGKTFTVGVDSTLSVTITRTAAEVVDTIQNFFSGAFNEEDGTNTTKLGLAGGTSSSSNGVSLDLVDQLLDDAILSADFNLNFLIEVNLREIQTVLNGSDIDDALLNSLGLRVNSWAASASLIVDPINAKFDVAGGIGVEVRDSSFALAVELAAPGPDEDGFFSTAKDIANANASSLIPSLAVPISAEVIVGFNVTDDVTIKPM